MRGELSVRRATVAARVRAGPRSPVSQDIIHNYAPGKIYSPSERSTAGDARGGPAGGGRARPVFFLGVRLPRREMEAGVGGGARVSAGPGAGRSKSLSSEIYAQSRGRWRDEARKQRLCRRRRARARPPFPPPLLPGAPRYNCAALHLRRR